jgi:F0F1-type ATP synthase assembly protein I
VTGPRGLSAGIQFAVCVVVPLVAGFYFWRPWGAVVGLLLGLAAGAWVVLRPLWIEADDGVPGPREGDDDDGSRPAG